MICKVGFAAGVLMHLQSLFYQIFSEFNLPTCKYTTNMVRGGKYVEKGQNKNKIIDLTTPEVEGERRHGMVEG